MNGRIGECEHGTPRVAEERRREGTQRDPSDSTSSCRSSCAGQPSTVPARCCAGRAPRCGMNRRAAALPAPCIRGHRDHHEEGSANLPCCRRSVSASRYISRWVSDPQSPDGPYIMAPSNWKRDNHVIVTNPGITLPERFPDATPYVAGYRNSLQGCGGRSDAL
jgi:hypothetical protein